MALASAMPPAVTFIQLDASLDLRGNLPGSSSRKRAIHLHRFDSETLFSLHHSLMVVSADRHRSVRPAHMSLLCASSIAEPFDRLRLQAILEQRAWVVKTR